MSKHDHPSFGSRPQSARLDGNAWEEVRVASPLAPTVNLRLVATADWLDGELGSFDAPSARVDDFLRRD